MEEQINKTIEKELLRAKKKFPQFCDKYTSGLTKKFVDSWLLYIRNVNNGIAKDEEQSVMTVLLEEALECVQALQREKYKDAYIEAAQVSAVAMRIMGKLQDEGKIS